MDVLGGARRRRSIALATALVTVWVSACEVDDPVIYQAEPSTPGEVRPGIFRLTYHLEPDVFPTWIDSVTVSYRGMSLPPYDTGFVLLQRSVLGGPATEREATFRPQAPGLSLVPVSVPVSGGETHLVYWSAAKNDVALCSIPCPPAAAQAVQVLDPATGDTITKLGGWVVPFGRITGSGSGQVRLRLVPEDLDARDRWMNPFGPAYGDASTPFYVSSGTAIFRASGSSTSPALDSVTPGSYPALSPDGSLLAFTRTTLADSTTATCTVSFGLGSCTQTTVTISEGARELWVRDLATGVERSLGAGSSPTFAATGGRVVVATAAGLDWVDVASGARTGIPNTAGAHSPVMSPDGKRLAFVAQWEGQPDVYVLAISTP